MKLDEILEIFKKCKTIEIFCLFFINTLKYAYVLLQMALISFIYIFLLQMNLVRENYKKKQ